VRRMRSGALLAILLATASVTAACGSPEREAINELRAAITKTSSLSATFTYVDTTYDGIETEVRGVVEDDFRYQAQVVRDGEPLMDEVVSDDLLANRFRDSTFIEQLLRSGGQPPKDPAAAQAALEGLRSGVWVGDGAGAPPLFNVAAERRKIGDDPIFDARRVLQYVEAVSRTQPVIKFNADSLDYKPKEDPFPKPAKGSGVTRYDFIRFPVPRPSEGQGNQTVPGEPSFRKMSVYVRNGLIFQILEDLDIRGRLDDIERNYDIDLPGSTLEQIETAINAINVVRAGQGQDPIRIRKMSMRFERQGEPLEVATPETKVTGDLSILINRGKRLPEPVSAPQG
jgi:hypothetical protein